MDFFILIVLFLYIPGLSASSFTRILRTSLDDSVDDVLLTYVNITHHVDCAKSCKSNCVAFTYEPETKECRTFAKRFCRNDTAEKLATVMLFVKVEKGQTPANPSDCNEMDPDVFCSGVYRITPSAGVSFDVYCDMETDNGPWTVIQNRQNGDEEFFRPWDDYKKGFGNPLGNFWLDDAMNLHNGMQFSTYDRDNDVKNDASCASINQGGWWYRACYDANLNGRIYVNGSDNSRSLVWDYFYPDVQWPHMMKTRMLVKH
ncbi:ryncolin-4-like [Pecten maximus]|uniref:ryncolin-4-like n=1 Tax=Pecten maximus TaxID=6579 RepID=UPI001458E170|nr:ryncolin-4-like [Pecten maximus]